MQNLGESPSVFGRGEATRANSWIKMPPRAAPGVTSVLIKDAGSRLCRGQPLAQALAPKTGALPNAESLWGIAASVSVAACGSWIRPRHPPAEVGAGELGAALRQRARAS